MGLLEWTCVEVPTEGLGLERRDPIGAKRCKLCEAEIKARLRRGSCRVVSAVKADFLMLYYRKQ